MVDKIHVLGDALGMWVSIPYSRYKSQLEYGLLRERIANILYQATGIPVRRKVGYCKYFAQSYDDYKESHIDRIIHKEEEPPVLVVLVDDEELDDYINENLDTIEITRGVYNEIDYASSKGVPIVLVTIDESRSEGTIMFCEDWHYGTDFISKNPGEDYTYFRYRAGFNLSHHGSDEMNPGAISFYTTTLHQMRQESTEILDRAGLFIFYDLKDPNVLTEQEIRANNIALGLEYADTSIKSIVSNLEKAKDDFKESLTNYPLTEKEAFPKLRRIISWHW